MVIFLIVRLSLQGLSVYVLTGIKQMETYSFTQKK